MFGVQVKVFNDKGFSCIRDLNEFTKNKLVMDIKVNVIQESTGIAYTQYTVIWQPRQ